MIEQIQLVIETVEAWQNAAGPTVMWRGRESHALNEAIVQAVHELRDSLLTTEFPEQQWHTVIAADRFVERFEAWEKDAEMPAPSMHPAGGAGLWEAYAAMVEAMKPRIFHQLEPIESLVKIGCTYKQIADMAGWVDKFGNPDLAKVKQEIAKPGTHYNPDKWVSPADKQRETELAQAWQTRCERIQEKLQQQEQEGGKVSYAEGPESLEDLVLLPNVTISQIMTIKPSATVEEIEEAAKRMGVRLNASVGIIHGQPASKIARQAAREEQAEQEDVERERVVDADARQGEEDLTVRLLALRDDGYRPGEISEILKREGMEISPQKIGRMLAAEASAEA